MLCNQSRGAWWSTKEKKEKQKQNNNNSKPENSNNKTGCLGNKMRNISLAFVFVLECVAFPFMNYFFKEHDICHKALWKAASSPFPLSKIEREREGERERESNLDF